MKNKRNTISTVSNKDMWKDAIIGILLSIVLIEVGIDNNFFFLDNKKQYYTLLLMYIWIFTLLIIVVEDEINILKRKIRKIRKILKNLEQDF